MCSADIHYTILRYVPSHIVSKRNNIKEETLQANLKKISYVSSQSNNKPLTIFNKEPY